MKPLQIHELDLCQGEQISCTTSGAGQLVPRFNVNISLGNPSIQWPDGFIKAAAKHKFAPNVGLDGGSPRPARKESVES